MINKRLYKYELWLAKSIPIIISAAYLLSLFVSYYNIDQSIFSSLFGVAVLPLLFVYISSFAFGFKLSNRVFIYYIIISWIIDIIDYYIGIPLSNTALLYMDVVLAGLTALAAIACAIKERNYSQRQLIIGNNGNDTGPNKIIYKYELLVIKTIPMVLSGICILNSSLSYFDIELPILSYIGGASLIMIVFMYLSSAVFKFCVYHRLFIHYLLFSMLLITVDYYTGFTANFEDIMLIVYNLIGISLFVLFGVNYKKNRCKENKL